MPREKLPNVYVPLDELDKMETNFTAQQQRLILRFMASQVRRGPCPKVPGALMVWCGRLAEFRGQNRRKLETDLPSISSKFWGFPEIERQVAAAEVQYAKSQKGGWAKAAKAQAGGLGGVIREMKPRGSARAGAQALPVEEEEEQRAPAPSSLTLSAPVAGGANPLGASSDTVGPASVPSSAPRVLRPDRVLFEKVCAKCGAYLQMWGSATDRWDPKCKACNLWMIDKPGERRREPALPEPVRAQPAERPRKRPKKAAQDAPGGAAGLAVDLGHGRNARA